MGRRAQLWLRRINTTRIPTGGRGFELLHQEGGQVFNLSIHPWLMGMPHRIKYLDEALRRIERFANVWHATPARSSGTTSMHDGLMD